MEQTAGAASPPGAVKKIIFIAIVLLAVFSLPYLIPAPISISRSYVAGFNNRAAILVLIAGTALFAWFTRGRIADGGKLDTKLSGRTLIAALVFTVAACVLRLHLGSDGSPGGETDYFLNREQMLLAGLTPYRQFEFAYGPLLLYPNVWITQLLHLTALQGYVCTWIASWLAGIAMIWAVVRSIDFPVPSRTLLFFFLVLTELIWTDFGGLNYTPFRAYAAAFGIIATQAVWVRSHKPWLMSLTAVAVFAAAVGISIDQAIGYAFGILAYQVLLTLSRNVVFPWTALALSALGIGLCSVVASRFGLLLTLREFASGGYSYPLLPSFSIIVALLSYIAAGCFLVRLLLLGRLQSVAVPLVLAGCALLPSALGRCDILHITAAVPAFVVGTASLYAMPSLRRSWGVAAFAGLVLIPFGLRRSDRLWHHLLPASMTLTAIAQRLNAVPQQRDSNQFYVSPGQLVSSSLPCDRTYFSPSFMPSPREPFRRSCLDTGFYLGLVDVITPQAIAAKVNELRARPTEPLLMENDPLADQFPVELGGMESLVTESGSVWLPRPRHAPLTYTPIADYIRAHYLPGPTAAEGRLRIWYPVSPDQSQE